MNVCKQVVFFICPLLLSANYSYSQVISVAYDYPVKPGSDHWKKYQDMDEMIAACQIPDSVLNVLSTDALAQTCLNYPLFPQINAFNSTQAGFDRLATKFNGFKELFVRDDSFDPIFNLYKEMDPQGYSNDWTSVQKGRFVQKFLFIEILLSQKAIIHNLDSDKKRQLALECRKTYDEKLQNGHLFGLIGLSHTAYLITNFLQQGNMTMDQNDPVFRFSKTGSMADPMVIEEISNLLNEYLSKK